MLGCVLAEILISQMNLLKEFLLFLMKYFLSSSFWVFHRFELCYCMRKQNIWRFHGHEIFPLLFYAHHVPFWDARDIFNLSIFTAQHIPSRNTICMCIFSLNE